MAECPKHPSSRFRRRLGKLCVRCHDGLEGPRRGPLSPPEGSGLEASRLPRPGLCHLAGIQDAANTRSGRVCPGWAVGSTRTGPGMTKSTRQRRKRRFERAGRPLCWNSPNPNRGFEPAPSRSSPKGGPDRGPGRRHLHRGHHITARSSTASPRERVKVQLAGGRGGAGPPRQAGRLA